LKISLIAGCRGEEHSGEDETASILRAERNGHFTSPGDIALSRTLNIIAKKTERGRLVLLLCDQHCPRAKRMVPEWVRNFNDQSGYAISERIAYHYHLVKHPLPFMNDSGPITEPTIAFLIGKEVYFFSGDIFDKDSVLEWLGQLDQDDVIIPKNHDELDEYLNTEKCEEKFLIYSPHDNCQIPQWRSIARIVRLKMHIRTIYVRRPIRDHPMATVFFKRLTLLDELDCIFMSFVQLHHYSSPLTITTPAEMVELLSSMTTDDECIRLDAGTVETHEIANQLSDLEMEYFSGERKLFHLEQSTAYLIVGATSGVAVVALAISIFWGLNGNAFASR
ncbi:hypothetical protein PFISCL1PPCAC_27802, partial [Pristionchus fissidentatus]